MRTIFPSFRRDASSYSSDGGSISEIRTESGGRALVDFADSGTWWVNGRKYLVVLLNVSSLDSFAGCCPFKGYAAVLERQGHKLRVVASGITDEYGGHSGLSLDLAPYRLNDRETLIGVRDHETWMVYLNRTYLELYRIVGRDLRRVFRHEAASVRFPNGMQAAFIAKRASTFQVVLKKPYNELSVDILTVRCRNANFDCAMKAKASEEVWLESALYRFDGTRYVEEFPDWGF